MELTLELLNGGTMTATFEKRKDDPLLILTVRKATPEELQRFCRGARNIHGIYRVEKRSKRAVVVVLARSIRANDPILTTIMHSLKRVLDSCATMPTSNNARTARSRR